MAYGDITSLDNLYLPALSGQGLQWVNGRGDYWVLFRWLWKSGGSDVYEGIFETREIDDAGNIGAIIDSHTLSDDMQGAAIQQIAEGVIVVAWVVPGSSPKILRFTTLSIDSSGNISEITSIDFVSDANLNYITRHPFLQSLGGNNYAFLYSTFTTQWESRVGTITITSSGAMVAVASLNPGYASVASVIRKVSDGVFVLQYGNHLRTVAIPASGLSLTDIDSVTLAITGFNSSRDLVKLGNGWWGLLYRYYVSSSDSRLATLQITDEGLIDAAVTDDQYINSYDYGSAQIVSISTDEDYNSYVGVNVLGTGSDCYFHTAKVSISGAVTRLKNWEWLGGQLYSLNLFLLGYNTAEYYVLVVVGDTNNFDGTGQAHTIRVDAPIPPTFSSLSPNEGKVGRTYDIVVLGTNLGLCTDANFGSGITVDGFAVIDSTTIHVTITVDADAAGGYRESLSITQMVMAPLLMGFISSPLKITTLFRSAASGYLISIWMGGSICMWYLKIFPPLLKLKGRTVKWSLISVMRWLGNGIR